MDDSHLDLRVLTERIKQQSAAIASNATAVKPPPPPVLYHYTTANGLLGILRSKVVWATDYRFLNDASEIEYGVSLLRKISTEIISNYDEPVIKEVVARAAGLPNVFEKLLDCYVACFCAQRELLHQWRFYAENGGGFSIGFSGKDLGERALVQSTRERAFLAPVIYDPKLQVELIKDLFLAAVDLIRPYAEMDVPDAIDYINRCANFVQGCATRYFLTFKHPAFAIEEEWRLFIVPFDVRGTRLEFRDGHFGLTPYVEINPAWDPEPSANRPMPVESVTHGPVSDPATAKHALRKLLRSLGYKDTKVLGSELPFRIPVR